MISDSNPTLAILAQCLNEIDIERYQEFRENRPGATQVRVNGLTVPVLRLPTDRVQPFLESVWRAGNMQFFSGALPDCPIEWNPRFRRVAGRIGCARRRVELSTAHYETCGPVALAVVLLHEQIHLSLWEDSLPFGHTTEFRRRSILMGMPGIYHELPLPERMARPLHRYGCLCGWVTTSRVRFRTPRACSACCEKYNRGRYDERFNLRYLGSVPSPAATPSVRAASFTGSR